jgi:hypothetical protein
VHMALVTEQGSVHGEPLGIILWFSPSQWMTPSYRRRD